MKLESIKSLKDLQLCHEELPTSGIGIIEYAYVHRPKIQPFVLYSVMKSHFGESNDLSFDEDKNPMAVPIEVQGFFH